jgi:hypothetical protein
MSDNKGQTVFLSVIGIATLLVAIIGATFAYFTTTMSGNSADVVAKTGTVGKVNFTAQALNLEKMLPGKTSEEKEVTVTLGTSDFDVDYICNLEVTGNEVVDMFLNVTGENAVADSNDKRLPIVKYATFDEDGTTELTPAGTAQKIKIAEGTLRSGETKTMKYSITFKETGTDQNAQQGMRFNATVSCGLESADGVYYNDANPSGTTTPPTAQ